MAKATVDDRWPSVIRLVRDDGHSEFFGFTAGGGLHCAPSMAALHQKAEDADAGRSDDVFLSFPPGIVGLHAVSPGFAVVRTEQVLSFSTPVHWYLLGQGNAIELGHRSDASYSGQGRGYTPVSLDEVLLVDGGMTRALIRGHGQRLTVLHLDDLRRVDLATQARPVHKLALADEQPLAATCEKAVVRVWSTETGEELARRETEDARPSGVCFLDGGEALTWHHLATPWRWRG